MQPIHHALETLQSDLREALARQDWEAIISLDPQCRMLIGEVVSMEAWSDQALRDQVEVLSTLYAELQLAARQERERIAGELTKLNQSKHANRAYESLG